MNKLVVLILATVLYGCETWHLHCSDYRPSVVWNNSVWGIFQSINPRLFQTEVHS